jgi:hypothetical protein
LALQQHPKGGICLVKQMGLRIPLYLLVFNRPVPGYEAIHRQHCWPPLLLLPAMLCSVLLPCAILILLCLLSIQGERWLILNMDCQLRSRGYGTIGPHEPAGPTIAGLCAHD